MADASWMVHRLEAFAEYLTASRQVVSLSTRFQRAVDPNSVPATSFAALGDAELTRSVATERVVLLTDSDGVLRAMHKLNLATWSIEKPTRLGERLDEATFDHLIAEWHADLRAFHHEARAELDIDSGSELTPAS
ncbi:MAG: hypothetical protein ACRBK7_18500 [Acidimicrobiales bacterium]